MTQSIVEPVITISSTTSLVFQFNCATLASFAEDLAHLASPDNDDTCMTINFRVNGYTFTLEYINQDKLELLESEEF